MKVAILDSKRKAYYRIINASTIIAGCLIFLAFILFLFKNKNLEIISASLLIISLLPIILGIVSSVLLAMKGKYYLDFDEQKETWLILNMKEYDFKMGDKGYMGYSGNYLVQENPSVKYEITSDEVEILLANEHTVSWTKIFEITDNKILDSSPKRLYNEIMWTLWATS